MSTLKALCAGGWWSAYNAKHRLIPKPPPAVSDRKPGNEATDWHSEVSDIHCSVHDKIWRWSDNKAKASLTINSCL